MEFDWCGPERGKRIDSFIDNLCEKFPKIASCVADRGFGDLLIWYPGLAGYIDSKCGCLIGSTSLCMIESLPSKWKFKEIVHQFSLSDTWHGAKICYVAWKCMVGEDVNLDKTDEGVYKFQYIDPLYKMIYTVGMDVSDEIISYAVAESFRTGRMTQLKEYMTDRLRSNLKKEV